MAKKKTKKPAKKKAALKPEPMTKEQADILLGQVQSMLTKIEKIENILKPTETVQNEQKEETTCDKA